MPFLPIIAAATLLQPMPADPPSSPTPGVAMLPAATAIARFPAEEADQGVAVDSRYFYAINNSAIGKYDKRTGKRVTHWQGDPKLYPHMNSCVVQTDELVCAASNHPRVPMASSVEFFDKKTLHHIRSVALPPYPGSLTWIEWHDGAWYALFANYTVRHGGTPGEDYRWTLLMKLDKHFQPLESWHFPEDVLADFAPMSSSGGTFGKNGLLYITGHTKPELYVMAFPKAGTILEHVATIPLVTHGQAFALDRNRPNTLWTIDRKARQVVESKIPNVGG